MLISIHDHTLKRVGFLSNDDSETPDFKDDNFHRYLAQGTSTFDFTVNKIKNGVVQDYVQLLNERAYFSFQYEGEDFLFDSVIVEEDDDKITFNCLSLNLEMRNEEVKALKNTVSHNIKWYFDQLGLINFAKISLGINQVKNDTRVINYDSEDTKLARLISVIQNFDAEFEFVTKLKRDGTLDNITLNIYKKNDGGDVQGVGQNRNDVLLSFGKNVTGVNRKVEKSQIFNSLYVTGKDGLSWKNSSWSVTNSEGQEEFYKRAGESYAKAPLSAQMFPSQLKSSSGDIFTNKNASTEYTTVNAMWGYALSQLKQYAYPLVTYEVTATSNLTVSSTGDGMPLHIGDTVRIQDKNFIDSDGNVGLFLSARVSELEISFTNPTSNKIMFSNYIKLKSEVSDDLTARMQEIINANTPYRPDITSTNGLQFKNGTGTTILGAHIYFGSDDKETIADNYEWSKDGTVVANAQTITVDASGVSEKAVYSFKATVGGKVVANQSVTITNVDDGTNGRSVTNVSQKWRLTTTTATPTQAWSDAGWLTTQPTTTATNKYLWSITRTTFNLAPLTQDVIEQKAVYGDKGDKGDQGVQGIQGVDGRQGIPGPKGADGKTQYTHIAYANSADGKTDFSTSDSNRAYIGMYVDFNINDSTTPSDYSWTLVKGADGTQGTPGKPGADGKTPYFHTAWSYSADGTNGFTTVYPNLNLLVNSSAKTKAGFFKDFDKVENGYGEVTRKGNNSYAGISMWDGFSIQPGDYKPGDTYTMSMDVMFTSWNFPAGVYLEEFWIGQRYTHNSDWSINSWKRICYIDLPKDPSKMLNQWIRITYTSTIPPHEDPSVYTESIFMTKFSGSGEASFTLRIRKPKQEPGSIATPYMQSASEVTTADWPKYIGHYTDFTQADSTNPSDYTWSLIRGNDGKDGATGKDGIAGKDGKGIKATAITYQASTNGTTAPTGTWSASVPPVAKGSFLWTRTIWTYTDNTTETGYAVAYMGTNGNNGNDGIAGKDGVGIKTTTITYAGSTSGTTAPTSGWTSTVPTVAAGSYLWTKTVWAYTDNTSETGYSVAKMGNDGATGPKGPQGPTGPAGSNGTPGTNAINIDLSNKSYNFLANLEVSDSGSVMQAVAGSTTTTFTALQGTAAINITALTCTTTLPTGMTVSIGTLNALSVVVTISVDNTMITPNGVLNFSITAGGVTTTKSFSYSLAINDLTVINLAAINSNLGNVKNIYSHYNGSGGGTYSGTIEINDENIKITATNDNDSNEVSKTQMNGENGIWHSTKLQKTNLPGVYVLSNWSLTGATLSFESQQSDLTYPNGYSYASYGIDAHARNIVGDSISQTNDVRTWTPITLNNVKSAVLMYKIINGIIHLNGQGNWGSFTANQSKTIATLPAELCPTRTVNKIITTQNTNNNDKPMEIQIEQGGNVNIWSMTASTGGRYGGFEESYPLG
ncbi:phage tail spike protein [Lactococcus lactis]|uniref:phage tail spike protein n=2 Tax=Lactococcus lactis TaxID=1358 RepID=UPI001CC2734A|nr:phage tail spike protein [Lactococcus lactis]